MVNYVILNVVGRYTIMQEYFVEETLFENLELLSSNGSESRIYLAQNGYNIPLCIKKYRTNFWLHNNSKTLLKKLVYLSKKLKSTGIIYPNLVFYDSIKYAKGDIKIMAIGLPYLKGYKHITEIEDFEKKCICLKKLISLLIYLTSQNIYPTDLNDSNILVSDTLDVELIDLDGYGCKVGNKNSTKYYREIYHAIKNKILLDLILNKEESNLVKTNMVSNESLKSILEIKGLDERTIDILLNNTDEVDLNTLLELLNTINPQFKEEKTKA